MVEKTVVSSNSTRPMLKYLPSRSPKGCMRLYSELPGTQLLNIIALTLSGYDL